MALDDNNEFILCVKRDNHFIGNFSNVPRLKEIETIKLKIHLFGVGRKFEESCFSFSLRTHTIKFTGPLFYHSLMIQASNQSDKKLRIIVNGQPYRFGYEEFSLITGILYTRDDSILFVESRLQNQYFTKDKIIRKSKLCDIYKRLSNNTVNYNIFRLLLIVTLEIILLDTQKAQKINKYLHLVEDLDKFNEFLRGKVCI